MFIKSLLRLHSYRVYDYQPRYYDEKKEQREQRLKEKGIHNHVTESSTRINFRNEWKSNSRLHSPSKSNFRIAIIFTILLLLAILLLRNTSFPI